MPSPGRWLAAASCLLLLGLASVVFTKIALVLSLLVVIAFAALPKSTSRERKRIFWLLVVSAIATGIGFLRFTVKEAVPSLVAAGNNAAAQTAVSRLRELSFVEDKMRELAVVDPDHDGVGSGGLIVELSGAGPVRGVDPMTPPLLSQQYSHLEPTSIGPAVVVAGYFYIVCLPKRGGGFTAHPEDPVDEELAERRFLSYAWPAVADHGAQGAFSLDEHENILASDNSVHGETVWAGPNFPPPCDAVLDEKTRYDWYVWRGKKPRAALPFDR